MLVHIKNEVQTKKVRATMKEQIRRGEEDTVFEKILKLVKKLNSNQKSGKGSYGVKRSSRHVQKEDTENSIQSKKKALEG